MSAIFVNIRAESYLGTRCGVDQTLLDSKSPQTRIGLIMIGHSSTSCVILFFSVWTHVDET